jgi:hypothetical protein
VRREWCTTTPFHRHSRCRSTARPGVYRFGLLEDFDHDLRKPYDRRRATPLTKLHATTLMAGEHQTHDYYMTIGPLFSDPSARQLYAEIASIEEPRRMRAVWERFLEYELGHVRFVAELFDEHGGP